MNYVNLIGKMSSKPQIIELENGGKVVKFSMSTDEVILTASGEKKKRKHWHRMTAWGKWARVMEELGTTGTELAIEGKLVTRFYNNNGLRKCVSEVEVNDLVFL
jgi:single-strand DNA-binding protein